ncbi:TRM11 family SAM-dependent methyltransferase [Patescibacteria group bacterium]
MKKATLAYGFVFGRSPLLSLAELENFLARENMDVEWLAASKQGALVRNIAMNDPQALLDKLGGSVRVVEVLDRISLPDLKNFNIPLTEALQADIMTRDYLGETDKNKITFGFSTFYMDETPKNLQRDVTAFLRQRARKIKQDLKSRKRSSRFVQTVKMDASLSSVQLRKQGIFNKNGLEWCVFFSGEQAYIGRTIAVQDFESYGKRDYERPYRNPKVGMLPPKIAQMMLNMTGKPEGAKILDPYCGLGTVIQEGLMMGYSVSGSDIDGKLVEQSKANLDWLKENYADKVVTEYGVAKGDARKVSAKLKKESIDAIVTESFLGPAYSVLPSSENIDDNFRKINRLHAQVLTSIRQVLKTDGVVVLILPFYRNPRNPQETAVFPYLDNILEVGYSVRQPISKALQGVSGITIPERGTLFYARPQQIVGREIVILERKERN